MNQKSYTPRQVNPPVQLSLSLCRKWNLHRTSRTLAPGLPSYYMFSRHNSLFRSFFRCAWCDPVRTGNRLCRDTACRTQQQQQQFSDASDNKKFSWCRDIAHVIMDARSALRPCYILPMFFFIFFFIPALVGQTAERIFTKLSNVVDIRCYMRTY